MTRTREENAADLAYEELENRHWNPTDYEDHPTFSVSDWRLAVDNGWTRESYVAWVNAQMEHELDCEAMSEEDEQG